MYWEGDVDDQNASFGLIVSLSSSGCLASVFLHIIVIGRGWGSLSGHPADGQVEDENGAMAGAFAVHREVAAKFPGRVGPAAQAKAVAATSSRSGRMRSR